MQPPSPFALPVETLPLVVHPTEQGPAGLALCAALAVEGPGWRFEYTITGDIDALLIPGPADPDPTDGLWRHTCLEAFVQEGAGPGYREFNLSPSGQWAVYRFAAQRERAADDTPPATGPSIALERRPRSLTLSAWVPRALLPAQPGAIGLTAVIETAAGRVSHWALRHPRDDRPDFHHAAGWTHRPGQPSFPNATPTA